MTFMNKPALRTPVSVLIGRRILSAYIFSDEPDADSVVLCLDDASDLSIEFNYRTRVAAEVIISKSEGDDPVVVQLVE